MLWTFVAFLQWHSDSNPITTMVRFHPLVEQQFAPHYNGGKLITCGAQHIMHLFTQLVSSSFTLHIITLNAPHNIIYKQQQSITTILLTFTIIPHTTITTMISNHIFLSLAADWPRVSIMTLHNRTLIFLFCAGSVISLKGRRERNM